MRKGSKRLITFVAVCGLYLFIAELIGVQGVPVYRAAASETCGADNLAGGLYSYFPLEDKNDVLGFAATGETATISYTPGLIGNALNVPTDVNNSMIYFGNSIGDRDNTYRDVMYNDATVNAWINIRSLNSLTEGGMSIISGAPAEREIYGGCVGDINHWELNLNGVPGCNIGICPPGLGSEFIGLIVSSYETNATTPDPDGDVFLRALEGSVLTNTWYMVTFTHDSVNHVWKLYIDGHLEADVTNIKGVAPGALTRACPYSIGDRPLASIYGKPFSGLIDEVGFWDRVLSEDEVLLLYNNGLGVPFEDLGETAVCSELSGYVALGQEGLYLKQGATIVSGDAGANLSSPGPYLDSGVEVSVGNSVTFLDPTSQVLGDSVKVKQGAQIYDVSYNELTNNGQILGQEITPLTLPLVANFPVVPTFAPGTENMDIPQQGAATIDAGSYGLLKVRQGGVITLTGGVYDFNEWDVGENVTVNVLAPIEIRVADKFAVDQGSYLGPAPSATELNATDIVIYVTGQNGNTGNIGATPKAAKFGINSTVIANVYVPNGTLWLRQGSEATGAFLAKWVIVGLSATVTHESGW